MQRHSWFALMLLALFSCSRSAHDPAPDPLAHEQLELDVIAIPPAAAAAPPEDAVTRTPPEERLLFTAGLLPGWTSERPLTGTAILLRNDAIDATIIVDIPTSSTENAATECAKLVRGYAQDPRARFGVMTVSGPGRASVDTWETTERGGTRYGIITVRQYGDRNQTSIAITGWWPKAHRNAAAADYDTFVDNVRLAH